MALNTIEVLQAARADLERYGRWTGAQEHRDGSCLFEALMLAGGSLYAVHEILPAVRLIASHIPDHWHGKVLPRCPSTRIIRFNDHPTTTDQDVFDLIDKALAELGALG